MLLRDYLSKYKITQRVMADRLGITISHLRVILTQKGMPSRSLAMRIETITNGEVTKEEAIFPPTYTPKQEIAFEEPVKKEEENEG